MNVMSRAQQHDIHMCEEAGEDDMSADYDDEEDAEDDWSMASQELQPLQSDDEQ
jgi:hypothetical protein